VRLGLLTVGIEVDVVRNHLIHSSIYPIQLSNSPKPTHGVKAKSSNHRQDPDR